jgi:hypothetical protein
MATYIALFLSLVSLLLMIIILVRFKKLFSTDSIIDKTKSQMNRVIMDVNNNANRDLELINESSRRLRALVNEADKKMENFKEATQLLRNSIAEAEKTAQKPKKSVYIDPDASYTVTNTVNRNAPAQQGSLFDDAEESVPKESPKAQKSILKDETVVTPDGAAYKEVPLIITKVYDEKMNIVKTQQEAKTIQSQTSDRNLKDKVEKLFRQGMQIDDIAAELSCPASEVQFIIDML